MYGKSLQEVERSWRVIITETLIVVLKVTQKEVLRVMLEVVLRIELCPVQNFASMQLAEIRQNLTSRRNRIFLLMEEVRRLRIQQRLKVGALHAFK